MGARVLNGPYYTYRSVSVGETCCCLLVHPIFRNAASLNLINITKLTQVTSHHPAEIIARPDTELLK